MEVIREGRTKQINETSQVKFNLQHKMQGDIFSSVKLNMKLLQILLAHAVFIIFCFKFISIFFKRGIYAYECVASCQFLWFSGLVDCEISNR